MTEPDITPEFIAKHNRTPERAIYGTLSRNCFEGRILQTASEKSGKKPSGTKLQTVSAICSQVPISAISAKPSRKSAAKQIVQTVSEQFSHTLIRQTPSAEFEICQTLSGESGLSIYETLSRKSQTN